MAVLFRNVSFNTLRGSRDAVLGVTSPGVLPYLTGVTGNLQRVRQRDLVALDAAIALEAEYTLYVDPGTDIASSDQLGNILSLMTGQPWPGDLPAGPNSYFQVINAQEGSTGLIPVRIVTLKRVIAGGLAHP